MQADPFASIAATLSSDAERCEAPARKEPRKLKPRVGAHWSQNASPQNILRIIQVFLHAGQGAEYTNKELCLMLSMGERHMHAYLTTLERWGWLDKRLGEAHGHRPPWHYLLTIPDPFEELDDDDDD